jgi:UDP-N-acetylglucosamine--N-acetylmuramyl-(pentapeptide) pyrophosphoryl-undecaprenol N-acetylglucosamine transferase
MNEYMADFIAENARTTAFHHIHATGEGEDGKRRMLEMLRERGVETLPENVDLREYIFESALVLNAADLVLCRAGASTLSELGSIGKPALIVPSPNVTNHHQEKNARLVEQAGGAKVLLEGEFDEQSFLQEIRNLLSDRESLSAMSAAMRALSVPDALDRIVDAVLEYARKGK